MKQTTADQTDSGKGISIGDVLFILAIIAIIIWTLSDFFIRIFLTLTGLSWLWKMCLESSENMADMLQSKLAIIRQRN